MRIKNANVFRSDGHFEPGNIAITGTQFADTSADSTEIDATGCYAIPGLIDVHLHGCIGYDFTNATTDQIAQMARYQAKNGTTAMCPATLTIPEAEIAEACRQIAACREPDGAAIVGINIEGPFLSPKRAGAQNPAYLHPPDLAMFNRLQAAAEGKIKLISIAPEMPGAMELIDAIHEDVICSLAHTTADYDTALEAFNRGARQLTHLFNGMPHLGHREPSVIGAAMDSPHAYAEMICDNIHIHPSAVRAAFRLFGDDRILMISDSIMAAGLTDGKYEIGGLAIDVQGRECRLDKENGALAGSVTNLLGCVRIAVTEMDIPLENAVKAASVNPARALGVFDERGSIEPGKFADLVLLNEDLTIRHVFLQGKQLV